MIVCRSCDVSTEPTVAVLDVTWVRSLSIANSCFSDFMEGILRWGDYISCPCIQITGSMWSSSVVVPMVVLSLFETHIVLSYLSRQHIVWMYFALLLVLTIAQTIMFNVVAAFFSSDATGSTVVTLPTGVGDILRDTTLEYNLPRSTKSTAPPASSAAVCSAIAV